jgi:ribonuclease HII
MLKLERTYYSDEVTLIVGVDEAGRGPLAGPVYAAAVVFPPNFKNAKINDSKKLTAKEREALFPLIKQKALGYGIASVSAEEIDRINIYEATKVAMKEALAQISVPYDLILTDAMPLKGLSTPVVPIIKGDAQCLNIAAASILAKVSRDHYMDELDQRYPQYAFKKHKGYGTKEHLEALAKYGPIPGVHRKTFRPVSSYYDEQIKLF